jgi:hypothetical protein
VSGETPKGDRSRRSFALSRRALVVLAVLAVLVLLIGVPAVIGAQPRYLGSLPSLADKYEPWAASTHVEAGCEGCHARPTAPAQLAYRVRLIGEFYLTLVSRSRVPAVFATPTNEACLTCHSDLRTVSPTGDLKIPHRAHVSILEMECVECHTYLVHETGPNGDHRPAMEDCLTCHNGDAANDACWACHTQKAAPDSHSSADWLIVHGDHADDPECDSCHRWAEGDWCIDCHAQRPRSHETDWRALHGDRVAQHRSCEACHESAFCVRCHGELPLLNYDPTLELVR